MKNIEKLQQVVEKLDSMEFVYKDSLYPAECKRLIREFIADNSEIKGTLRCKDFVSKDDNRPTMKCIFHDKEWKVAVATNAHVLFTSEAEYVETEGNGLRDTYGEVTQWTKEQRNYPNWKAVMPTKTVPVTIREDLDRIIKLAEADVKSRGKKSSREKWQAAVLVDGLHWIRTDFAKNIVKAGLDGWESSAGAAVEPAPNRAIYKKWDGKELLIMTWMKDDQTEEEISRGYCVC